MGASGRGPAFIIQGSLYLAGIYLVLDVCQVPGLGTVDIKTSKAEERKQHRAAEWPSGSQPCHLLACRSLASCVIWSLSFLIGKAGIIILVVETK